MILGTSFQLNLYFNCNFLFILIAMLRCFLIFEFASGKLLFIFVYYLRLSFYANFRSFLSVFVIILLLCFFLFCSFYYFILLFYLCHLLQISLLCFIVGRFLPFLLQLWWMYFTNTSLLFILHCYQLITIFSPFSSAFLRYFLHTIFHIFFLSSSSKILLNISKSAKLSFLFLSLPFPLHYNRHTFLSSPFIFSPVSLFHSMLILPFHKLSSTILPCLLLLPLFALFVAQCFLLLLSTSITSSNSSKIALIFLLFIPFSLFFYYDYGGSVKL